MCDRSMWNVDGQKRGGKKDTDLKISGTVKSSLFFQRKRFDLQKYEFA